MPTPSPTTRRLWPTLSNGFPFGLAIGAVVALPRSTPGHRRRKNHAKHSDSAQVFGLGAIRVAGLWSGGAQRQRKRARFDPQDPKPQPRLVFRGSSPRRLDPAATWPQRSRDRAATCREALDPGIGPDHADLNLTINGTYLAVLGFGTQRGTTSTPARRRHGARLRRRWGSRVNQPIGPCVPRRSHHGMILTERDLRVWGADLSR